MLPPREVIWSGAVRADNTSVSPFFYVMHLGKGCNEKIAKHEETNIVKRVMNIVKRVL